ncbi:MazG nucleotide pyrophosphohydrolase domain-containing protein [Arthrobacter sp. ISL-30]|uniref:MazG nucleotide pyrophosphohydrolase domain-containing protein n=1 Tax=Arthrobacter sp. ISL-30 TaxID=2819109 RepID=UPI001BE58E51|nr:MazG nucleotide pyrophosphohydrolase domain-containing protein [Arthrobacter sp. ISL-30]MBT2515125.1 nucleotide pyrophosphohydrolase [Arthrobacter sp. ISL-30]
MGALTHESLVEYLIEEAYEVVESIEGEAAGSGTPDELLGELGDVLLQVVLHARLAEEHGRFNFDDVVQTLTAKMIRRNPHVFKSDGTLQESFPATVDEIVQKWDSIKLAEKPARRDAFEGIPARLPALARAQKSLDRAARSRQARSPEAAELAGSGQARSPEFATEEDLGELLFAVVASARERGFDAERALRGAVTRYQGSHRDPT